MKFIDAKNDLPVQVHPYHAYARIYEHQNGKSEMWYVVDADEDASLIYEFARPVTADMPKEAVSTGTFK